MLPNVAARCPVETRRQEFFRQKGPLRAVMRGKRWLLLPHWHNLSASKRSQLNPAWRAIQRPTPESSG